MVSEKEDFRVQGPQHRVAAEQPGKHQDLGCEEEPDAELARVVLLLERLEVVREVLGVLVGSFWESGLRHGGFLVFSTQYSVLST